MTAKIVQIPLAQLIINEDWNGRSVGWKDSEGGETIEGKEKHTFAQLVESVKARGIETPVLVRPEGGKSQKYVLVYGFRRAAAAIEAGLKAIPAHVKELTEAQARAENIRENAEREDVSVADLVFSVRELDAANEKTGAQLTETELGQMIGKSQQYAGKMRKLAHGLAPDVLDAWRKARRTVPYNDMLDIGKLEKPKQMAAFVKALKGENEDGSTKEKGKSGKAGQAEKLKKQAFRVGEILGIATRLELIDDQDYDWAELGWDDFLSLKGDGLKGKALKEVAKSALEGFEAGKNPQAGEDDDAAE